PGGETVPVGVLLGVIAEAGDDVAALIASAPAPAPPSAAPATTSAAGAAPARAGAPALAVAAPSTPAPTPAASPRPPAVAPVPMRPSPVTSAPAAAVAAQPSGGRVKASPLAKKIAAQTGVDLRLLQGSGPGGRIVRRDVETAGAAPAAMRAVPDAEFEDRPLSQMRAA